MAPEVIMTDPENPSSRGAYYDSKADIWSIGITAIEIAEKNPPLSDIHPMRALLLIPTQQLGLAKPKNFSKVFQDFVQICLTKDPKKRPSAADLLKHPFLAKAASMPRQKIIADLVQRAKIARERRKMGLDVDDDEDDEKRQEVPDKVVHETMKWAQKASAPDQLDSATTLQQIYSPDQSGFPTFAETLKSQSYRPLAPKHIGKVFRIEISTADVLDERYLIVGCGDGMFFYDLQTIDEKPDPIPLIPNTRFKQIEVCEEYGVLMALSGKNDHVRQYNLNSLRKLIMYLSGQSIAEIVKSHSTTSQPLIPKDTNIDEASLIKKWYAASLSI